MTDRQRKPPVLFRRLVRDRVPEKLDQSEENSICRVLGDEERVEAYGNKLLEEAYELYREWKRRNAGGILDESADALEIILAILGSHDLGLEELLERWRQKNETEGGYSKGILVESGGQGFPEWAIEGAPALILTRLRRDSLVEKLRSEFNKSKDAWIVSAFFSPGRTNLLLDDFRRFIELGGNLSVILSTMGNFVRPDHFTHLQSFVPGIQLRVFHPPGIPYEESPPNFHPKAFLFRHQDGTGAMIIGSSNLTEGGLRANIEWNYYTSLEVNLPYDGPSPFNTALEEFRRCWEEDCTEVTKDFLEGYRRRWALTRKAVPAIDQEAWKGLDRPRAEIEPNEAQTEGLESLRVARNQGMKKAVVIAATGVGKTYLAALDYGQSGMRNILYIAHRENILRKSRESFREVLGDPRFGSIMGGGNPYPPGRSAVFAMIQTLARKTNLRLFSPEHFDYVVVDEFHHGMARSYLKVLEHLKPKFLLGLTATPERMDGRDVLALCDYNVAQELRLLAAVEKGLLVPFQYYAVYDETDYEQIAWRGTRYDEEELDRALESDTRTAIVANNLRKFLPSSGKIKALAFCSSLAHARFTARKLTHDHGIEALPLLADSTEEERAAAIRRLQDERDGLLVIAAVDIFNEGVDIPPLTHVLFLRPTQSFTIFLQQLGRGLRKSPGKDFLVVIDFVGNFRKAHVAPLALSGYTSLDEYLVDRLAGLMVPFVESRLPDGCYVNADLAVQRIWDLEIKRILDRGISIQERLKELYQEIKEDLGGESPKLVDFLANSRDVDPYAFIKVFGGWLRAKLACEGELPSNERALLDTPGEAFLKYIEIDLNPVRSYKMVVLQTLLSLPGTSWKVDEIARGFLYYYLDNPERISDFDELAKEGNPAAYPLQKVIAHIKRMPLKYLSNKEKDWFILDHVLNTFSLKAEMDPYWMDPGFLELVSERVEFLLARYFYQRAAKCSLECHDETLKEGFPLEPGFTERAFSERPLRAGDRREIALMLSGRKYKADLVRKETGKEYWVMYPGNQTLVAALRASIAERNSKGNRTFTITLVATDTLLIRSEQGASTLKGIVTEIPYAKQTESGYTKAFREMLRKDPGADSWEMSFEKRAYEGNMDLEIREGPAFLAWTNRRYDDITRFPQRMKAAATALFADGHRGEYHVGAKGKIVRITRRQG